MDKIKAYAWSKLIDGDNTLCLNYPLDENSIVFDIGGYHGDFTDRINKKYNCHVFVFEPVTEFYNFIITRFKDNSKIKVFNIAFGKENKEKEIVITNDSTSFFNEFKNGLSKERVKIKKLSDFLDENNIGVIDLINMNIEGYEYDVLTDIFNNSIQNCIKNIQIQFHDIPEISDNVKQNINNKLELYFNKSFKFDFLWESWRNKNLPAGRIKSNIDCSKLFDIIIDLQSKIEILTGELNKCKSELSTKTHGYNLMRAQIGTVISKIDHEIEVFKPLIKK